MIWKRTILSALLLCILTADPGIASQKVYVLNTLSQNLSVIDLESGTVNADAVPVGLYANDIEICDDRIFVVNSGINEIQVIGLNTLQTTKRFNTGNGTNPYFLECIDDQTLAVSLLFSDEVAIIDQQSEEMHKIAVETGPEGVCRQGGNLFVANTNFVSFGNFNPGTVSIIDLDSRMVIKTLTTGINPQVIRTDTQGNIYVLATGNFSDIYSRVYRINPASLTITDSLELPDNLFVTNMTIGPMNRMFLATATTDVFGRILVYDLEENIYIRNSDNAIAGGPGIAVDRNGSVYAADFNRDSLFTYDKTLSKTGAYLVGDGPLSVALHPDLQTWVRADPQDQPAVYPQVELFGNYPNPFNAQTTIRYTVGAYGNTPQQMELTIHTIMGQKIATLVSENQIPGDYTVHWDASEMSSGIYYYLLTTHSQATNANDQIQNSPAGRQSGKMVLVK